MLKCRLHMCVVFACARFILLSILLNIFQIAHCNCVNRSLLELFQKMRISFRVEKTKWKYGEKKWTYVCSAIFMSNVSIVPVFTWKMCNTILMIVVLLWSSSFKHSTRRAHDPVVYTAFVSLTRSTSIDNMTASYTPVVSVNSISLYSFKTIRT